MNPNMDRKPIGLTEKEKASPVSKYYTETLAPPTNPAALQALLAGPMDPKLAKNPYETVPVLLQPGYTEGENGYCVMEDGAGYLAVLRKFMKLPLKKTAVKVDSPLSLVYFGGSFLSFF